MAEAEAREDITIELGETEAQVLMRFSTMEQQQQPFYPIWELFVRAVSQLVARRQLDLLSTDILSPGQKRQHTILVKDLNYHPFNLSNREVNLNRARYLLALLEGYRFLDDPARENTPDWWPRNPTDLIQRIKQEREEMDTLGYVANIQRGLVAQSGEEDLREEESSPSNGKRKRAQ